MPVAVTLRREPTYDADLDHLLHTPDRQDEKGAEDIDGTANLGEKVGEETHLLGPPVSEGPDGGEGDGRSVWWSLKNVRQSMRSVPIFLWRGMWRRVIKSCILVAKVFSSHFLPSVSPYLLFCKDIDNGLDMSPFCISLKRRKTEPSVGVGIAFRGSSGLGAGRSLDIGFACRFSCDYRARVVSWGCREVLSVIGCLLMLMLYGRKHMGL